MARDPVVIKDDYIEQKMLQEKSDGKFRNRSSMNSHTTTQKLSSLNFQTEKERINNSLANNLTDTAPGVNPVDCFYRRLRERNK